jgi:hypothetical protein
MPDSDSACITLTDWFFQRCHRIKPWPLRINKIPSETLAESYSTLPTSVGGGHQLGIFNPQLWEWGSFVEILAFAWNLRENQWPAALCMSTYTTNGEFMLGPNFKHPWSYGISPHPPSIFVGRLPLGVFWKTAISSMSSPAEGSPTISSMEFFRTWQGPQGSTGHTGIPQKMDRWVRENGDDPMELGGACFHTNTHKPIWKWNWKWCLL